METRAIDLATALLAATSALCCAVVVGCAFLLVAGAAAPSEHEWAAWCAAAALACASVAALTAITRAAGGLRPSALGVAWGLAFAWPQWIADDGASPGVIGATLPVERDPSPGRSFRAYYRALDRRDFRRAWRSLSPAVRASFGGLERWSAGFAATLSSTPSELRMTTGGDYATVSHVLTARDRAACGVLVRRFSVQWRLRRTAEAWRAIALTAQQLGAPAACG